MEQLSSVATKFILHWGEMGTRWGINRTVAQIHALLFLSPKPLNAEQIADRLGQMKGALMKIGQMASYLDEGLPEPLRLALAQLQSHAPPISFELARGVVESELGAPLSELFVEFDPDPIAAASMVRRKA